MARTTQDVVQALELSDAEIARIATAARERVLAGHTSDHRARQLERLLDEAAAPQSSLATA